MSGRQRQVGMRLNSEQGLGLSLIRGDVRIGDAERRRSYFRMSPAGVAGLEYIPSRARSTLSMAFKQTGLRRAC